MSKTCLGVGFLLSTLGEIVRGLYRLGENGAIGGEPNRRVELRLEYRPGMAESQWMDPLAFPVRSFP